MIDAPVPERPVRLFKYLAPERLDALDGWLRCSPAIVLNDVFEMTTNFTAWSTPQELKDLVLEKWPATLDAAVADAFLKVEQHKGLSREQVLSLPGARERLDAFLRQWSDVTPLVRTALDSVLPRFNEMATDKLSSALGVVSFTEQPASLLMWAHYADRHMGFVVEYDPGHSWFDRRRGPDDEYFRLRPVRYQQERAALVATNTSGEQVFLTKSVDWEYEREWRVLLPIEGCEVRAPDERNGMSVHAVQVPREAIKCVIVGARMTPATREALKIAAKGLPLCEAVPRRDVYGLEVRGLG